MTMREADLEKIVGMVAVVFLVSVAVSEGLNGRLIISGLISIIAIAAPKQLDKLPFT